MSANLLVSNKKILKNKYKTKERLSNKEISNGKNNLALFYVWIPKNLKARQEKAKRCTKVEISYSSKITSNKKETQHKNMAL